MTAASQTLLDARRMEECADWPTAEEKYREVIQQQGVSAEVCFRLGLVCLRQRKFRQAADALSEATRLQPDFAEAWSNLGVSLGSQGQSQLAEVAFRQAVQLAPNRADIQRNWARAQMELGKLEPRSSDTVAPPRTSTFVASAKHQALAANESTAAVSLIAADRYEDAVGKLKTAISLCPDVAAYHNNLAVAYSRQGKVEEAMQSFRKAVALDPTNAEFQYNLAGAFFRQGKLDAAEDGYRQALRSRPTYAEAYYNLGLVLERLWKLDQAIECYRAAIQLKPDDAEAHNNLGIALAFGLELDAAVKSFHQALRYKPNYADAHGNLATVLVKQKKLGEAIASYRCALRYQPDSQSALGGLLRQLQQVCLWDDVMELAQQAIVAMENTVDYDPAERFAPFDFLALPVLTTAKQQTRCAKNWTQRRLNAAPMSVKQPLYHRQRRSKQRITIGYLSADFRSHVIPYLVAGLFEQHNKRQFEVIAYSYGQNDGSAIRQRIERGVEKFEDLYSASFAEAAQRIAVDEVDILVDLTGYTSNARTEILIPRPAPIQVSFLGYAGSMAAPFIDYILVDDFVVPEDQQQFYQERLVHLPGSYYVNDSHRDIDERTPSRQACGLPENGFVFCCFNNNYKITPQMFGLWMELLKELPGSVIWLLEANAFAPGNLRKEAEKHGISSDRLVFARRLPLREHLARHRLADLFLDTLPYNAHTTTSDSLWVGCPVLTTAGQTFSSRVAGSLLRAVGLPELITYNLNDYRAVALDLARNPRKLSALRDKLKAHIATSHLFDPSEFAKNLEKAYVSMWDNYLAGNPPRAFRVEADD